jgi:pantetheine-phosphate adenylyltransferase
VNRLSRKPPHVIAIYPGSFDPITNGHLDLIERGSRMFDRLIVSILRNDAKKPLFSVEERVEMLCEVVDVYPNVEVDSFDGLLVDHAAARSATVLLRGIRAISDYEYELQMALMNRRLSPQIETVFMMAHEAYFFHVPVGEEVAGWAGTLQAGAAVGESRCTRVIKTGQRGIRRGNMQAAISPIPERISSISVFPLKVSAEAEASQRRRGRGRFRGRWADSRLPTISSGRPSAP